jgi:hydrogenase maturation protease
VLVVAGKLVFAWGNPSRGDDALGPEFLVRMAASRAESGRCDVVELLTDFQLQPEHATDLHGRDLVLFVDASIACPPPFTFARVAVRRDSSFTSHALTPGALLAAYEQVYGRPPPPCYALAIRGYRFELGEGIGATAMHNLDAALAFARTLLEAPFPAVWDRMADQPEPQPRGL